MGAPHFTACEAPIPHPHPPALPLIPIWSSILRIHRTTFILAQTIVYSVWYDAQKRRSMALLTTAGPDRARFDSSAILQSHDTLISASPS
jgi:hypothetical protein